MPSMPNITHAQIVAAVTWVISQAVAWGWVNNDSGQRLISAAATILSAAWVLSDAYLRGKRNEHAAAVAIAGADTTNDPVTVVDPNS